MEPPPAGVGEFQIAGLIQDEVHLIPSCFQKLNYEFLKAYLVLCPASQLFNICMANWHKTVVYYLLW